MNPLIRTEYCLLCSTPHILYLTPDAQAWQCTLCNEKYWLDDNERLAYMVFNGVGHDEAEKDLRNGLPIFADLI